MTALDTTTWVFTIALAGSVLTGLGILLGQRLDLAEQARRDLEWRRLHRVVQQARGDR